MGGSTRGAVFVFGWLLLAGTIAAAIAPSEDVPGKRRNHRDAGLVDGGAIDGGADGGGIEDAGSEDAGSSDGGSSDAGQPDAGPVDPFGVLELYPTKPDGETWFLSADPLSDPRFDPQTTITQNADGSWNTTSMSVRMRVSTSTGYQPSLITTYDRNVLAAQGYMQSPNDWHNVEITGYVKLNRARTTTDDFSWYGRGGRHSADLPCEGSGYHGNLTFDGRTRWQKESWHVYYDQLPYVQTTSPLRGRWVGLKAVMRDTVVDGNVAVKLELWLNDNADKLSWTEVYDANDDGTWAGNATFCGASDDKIPISWGGPLMFFRWDGATSVDFKWLSVREIQSE